MQRRWSRWNHVLFLAMALGLGSLAAFCQTAPQAADTQGITGEWDGKVTRLRLVVTIGQSSDGSLNGKLTSVDQGNITIPINTVSFQRNVLHLEMKTIAAGYEGTLSGDGAEINGTFTQGGNSIPLILRRPGASAAAFTLKPRTIGRVSLEPCRTQDGNTEGLCGKYEVYENRQTQSGRKIALNIMVLPATGDKPSADPFFPLAGGPGQSAVEAFPVAGYTAKVRQQRDVVLVDQRGTGESNPLPCQLRDPQDAQTVVGEFYSLEKLRACRAELEKHADLTQYTTSISADDLDEVRQAMGYDKINVFGGSYGSRAALVYLQRHGDHVRTLTLEAVATNQYRIPITFARTIQSSVDRLIELCGADAACHKDYPNLRAEFNAVLSRLGKAPAQFKVNNPGPQPVTLSRGMFVANLRGVLYVPELASQFPYMIHQAFQDDWSVYGASVLLLTKSFDKVLSRGLSFSVICAEDVNKITEAQIKQETAHTYIGDFQVRLYQQACRQWPQASIPADFYNPIRSEVPALIISGSLDPATPPETTTQIVRDFKNSRVVVIRQGTHGTGSPCIDGMISDFVAKGSSTGLDASCADQIHLPEFLTQHRIDELRQKAGQ
jgi:pimeloyl-ACP methyl ester carboxylesterase